MSRPIWWKCDSGHMGSFLGVVCVTEKKKQKIMREVIRVHGNKHVCSGTVFTVAASQAGLEIEKSGRLVFQVKNKNLTGSIV